MATMMFVFLPAVLIVLLGVIGIVLTLSGAIGRDNKRLSIGLILLGTVIAIVSYLLIPLVGWHDASLSTSQEFGRVLMILLMTAGVTLAALGVVGFISKDFFWKAPAANR